ncbi:MAG: hypothetical protein JW793_05605 [Acidobacteria bacterium]|nr:hypothetical protein [Acidobacteriota bacterium]
MNYYNYFTEIEEHFVKRRGKHLLVSPMDWGLMAAWRDAGVPLQVAIRGIDIAMDGFFSRQRRGSAKINSLCYCHDSVMEEFARHRESRVGETHTVSRAGSGDKEASPDSRNEDEISEAVEYLSAIIDEITAVSAKRDLSGFAIEGLERTRERLEEELQALETCARADLEALERDLGIADGILVEALRSAVPAAQAAEWEKEAKTELKVYRKKLPKELYGKIYDTFMRSRIHREFQIREFSLFRL